MALEGGFRRLIIESDSLQFITLWKNGRQQRSEIAVILEEMEELALTSKLFLIVCILNRRL
jgi:hypothetical protein